MPEQRKSDALPDGPKGNRGDDDGQAVATKENIVQLGELSLEVLQSSEANCYEVVDVRRDITLAEGETKGAALHNFIKKTCKVALRLANC